MKIIDRTTFLSLPAGVLYQKYIPCVFDNLEIKGDTLRMPNPEDGTCGDWFVQYVGLDHEEDDGNYIAHKDGNQIPVIVTPYLTVDLNIQGRDGLYDEDQLFAVWEKEDVELLIERLQECFKISP